MFVLQLFQGSLITTIYGGRCKITTKTRVGIKASLEPPEPEQRVQENRQLYKGIKKDITY